jgi:hypothetical protein
MCVRACVRARVRTWRPGGVPACVVGSPPVGRAYGVAVYEEAGKFTQALQALDRAMDICQTTMGVVRDRRATPRPSSADLASTPPPPCTMSPLSVDLTDQDHPKTVFAAEARVAAYSRYRASRGQPLPAAPPPSADQELARLRAEVDRAKRDGQATVGGGNNAATTTV